MSPDLRVGLLGLPYDAGSSFLRGAAQAPGRIREALHAGSSNLCAENGVDLNGHSAFTDLGDLELPEDPEAFRLIETAVADRLGEGVRVLALGGDHAITYPVVQAYAGVHERLTVLHLDAHPDLYDAFEGNRYSHACPFARIMEAGLAARLVQVGIRTMNAHQRRQAERFGVEVVEMKEWTPSVDLALDGPVYLSLDMDVLDPAFAPGVSHHEPGGFSTRDVIRIIQHIDAPIVGADVVEFNPGRDPVGITAMAAAKLVKEIAASMIGWATHGRSGS